MNKVNQELNSQVERVKLDLQSKTTSGVSVKDYESKFFNRELFFVTTYLGNNVKNKSNKTSFLHLLTKRYLRLQNAGRFDIFRKNYFC